MNDSLCTLDNLLKYLEGKKEKLYIPYYQRGYRWKALEIRQLLDDVRDNCNGLYFLQLLAVREDCENRKLRIIDGQQRLTTVLIALDCLDDGKRCSELMEYETRNSKEPGTLDSYFKSEACETIKNWITENCKIDKQKEEVFGKLMKCVFLYFPISNATAEFDFFSRLNTWKISATDAELVKCFFLSDDDPAEIEKRAIKWNLIERQLSDSSFWGVFANNEVVAKDRMGVFLSLVDIAKSDGRKCSSEERYPLFVTYKSASSACTKHELWEKVEFVFYMMRKWYADECSRHLIGWFFHRKHCEVKEVTDGLLDMAFNAAKTLVSNGEWLKSPELYADGGDNLHRYLLLANVAWCSERHGVSFDFYRCSLIDTWSIEHVHARNQRNLSELEFKGLDFNSDDGEADETMKEQLWKEYEKIGDKGAANDFLREHLSSKCGYPEEDEDNSLGNLALLPRDANSCLNDKLFKGKQREILSWVLARDKSSYWAPPLTVAMFTKEVGEPKDRFLDYWSNPDREAYVKTVETTIEEFMKHFGKGGEK